MTPGWSAFGGQAISPYVGPIEENELILGHSVRLSFSVKYSISDRRSPLVAPP
jgi:hypothetical protein